MLLVLCERARNLSMSCSPSPRRSLFRLRSHCTPPFTRSFCKRPRIIRRRSDILGACSCLLFPSRRWGGGLPAGPLCSFREKHFGERSRCSRHLVSCSTCSLAMPFHFPKQGGDTRLGDTCSGWSNSNRGIRLLFHRLHARVAELYLVR